jgi:hypothetical protein
MVSRIRAAAQVGSGCSRFGIFMRLNIPYEHLKPAPKPDWAFATEVRPLPGYGLGIRV